MKFYFRLEAPYEWVRVNEDASGEQSRVDSYGEVNELAEYSFEAGDELVGLVSGEWVSSHNVELPAKTKKLFTAALPYALEESISEDVENMHFIIPDWKAGEACQVLAISKEKMQQWKSIIDEHRLPASKLIADHSLLPMHDVAECTFAVDDGHWDFGNKVVHWLEYPVSSSIDLWGDQYRPSTRRSGGNPYILPLLILAFVVIGKVGFDLYQTIALKTEMSAIKKEMQLSFQNALPELGEVESGQEKSVMEQALKRLSRQGQKMNMQSMLAAVSRALKNEGVSLSDLSFQNDELSMTCRLSDFSQVDRLTKQFNANARLSATLQSSEAEDGLISASYLISIKR